MQLDSRPASTALRSLAELVGRQESLLTLLGLIRRAAHSFGPLVESGAALVSCSDEFNAELRSTFDRDVARWLSSPNVPLHRRLFSQANLGGRVEPGAIALANDHFTVLSRQGGRKLLVLVIASHVGRRKEGEAWTWGEIDRFGRSSPCCGALTLLLAAPRATAAVRFPWFDQMTAFYGPDRLTALREDHGPHRMVRIAAVHAVLQAETAITDLMRDPPTTDTVLLLVPMILINQRGRDETILAGVHHLVFEGGLGRLEHGSALRSTPASLHITETRERLRIESPFDEVSDAAAAPAAGPRPAELPRALVEQARSADVREHVERWRTQVRGVAKDRHGLRLYARPLLRAFLQGLGVVAPELGLASLAIQGGDALRKSAHLKKLLAQGPSSEEALRVLHDIEPELQQLGHEEAGEILEILVAEHGPLG